MTRTSLLLLLALPQLASAYTPEWAASAPVVMLDGTIEVPMYRGESTDFLPTVEVAFPAEGDAPPQKVLAFVRGGGVVTVSEAFAKTLGLKIKGKDQSGKFQGVLIPEISIGGLILTQVHAVVAKSTALVGARDVQMSIPLHRLAAVSSILPSKGVVRFSPESEAESLINTLSHQADIVSTSVSKKVYLHGRKYLSAPMELGLLEGSFGDTEGLVRFEYFFREGFTAKPELLSGAFISHGVASGYQDITVGDLRFEKAFMYSDPLMEERGHVDSLGTLSYAQLYNVDVIWAPSIQRAAYAKTSEVKWSDADEWTFSQVKAEVAYQRAQEAASSEEDSDSGPEAELSRRFAIYKAQREVGGPSLAQAKALTQVGADHCEAYLEYGNALMHRGEHTQALTALTKAMTMWEAWDSQSFKTREAVVAGEKIPVNADTLQQDSSCFVAAGALAKTYLAMGEHAKVKELFETHLGLDGTLARVYAVSLLQQGQYEAAYGAFRRAKNMRNDGVYAALGYAYVAGKLGKEGILESTIASNEVEIMASPLLTGMTAEYLVEINGAPAATQWLGSLAKRHPGAVVPRLMQGINANYAKDEVALKVILSELKPLITRDEQRYAENLDSQLARAIYLALAGDQNAAMKTLKVATKAHGVNRESVLAKAMVAMISGEHAVSAKALAQFQIEYPGFPLPDAWTRLHAAPAE